MHLRVVLLTNHVLHSPNKAGFHWLADAFWRAGHHVLVFSESLSWLSWLRRDRRLHSVDRLSINRLESVRERLHSYVWLTPFHPLNLRFSWLNRLSGSFMELYGRLPLRAVEESFRQANLFVFDSDHGLFLFDRIKRLNPRARYVYRVSDDIPTLKHHPVVLATEDRVAPLFDLVSVPSEAIYRRLAHLPRIALHHHGLRKELFEQPCANPYPRPGPNLLFIGRRYLDVDFLRQALALFPDWSFHLFGPWQHLPSAPNLTIHGERPFEELIPYLRHADVGLQTLEYTPGAECFTDSLKIQQYTYCRLPIVAPDFLRCNRENMVYYQPGNPDSTRTALMQARAVDRARIRIDTIPTWDGLAEILAG